MRALDAHDVLGLWERCTPLHPVDRTLAMLRAGWPDVPADVLAALPIGERERRAVALRLRSFGGACAGADDCPACGEAHEIDLPLDAILDAPEAPSVPVTVDTGRYTLVVRVPDSRDQGAITRCADAESGLQALVARCVLAVARDGEAVDVASLPAPAIEAAADAIAALDPNAETLLALSCARCGHAWTLVFDGGEFLWRELAARARRLLYEVHVLARGYGWDEAAILGMTPRRRAAYLDLVGR